jgi:hypothetical protein
VKLLLIGCLWKKLFELATLAASHNPLEHLFDGVLGGRRDSDPGSDLKSLDGPGERPRKVVRENVVERFWHRLWGGLQVYWDLWAFDQPGKLSATIMSNDGGLCTPLRAEVLRGFKLMVLSAGGGILISSERIKRRREDSSWKKGDLHIYL